MKKGSSIEIRNLYKSYGDRTLFQDFNCSIGEGEFVVITGSSGCGKTTLLNMIGGLEPVTGGTILIDGLDITRQKNLRKYYRDVGEVIASIGLLYNIPVAEEDPYEIDGFENYYGVDSMLTNSWAVNKDTGCTIDLTLTSEEGKVFDGEYAMSFAYNETENGWAGATISKEVDWSDCDALQFYTIPDGKHQKVVIQLTANGKVYEAYLNEYDDYAANDGTAPLKVTIPFTEFAQACNGDSCDSCLPQISFKKVKI